MGITGVTVLSILWKVNEDNRIRFIIIPDHY